MFRTAGTVRTVRTVRTVQTVGIVRTVRTVRTIRLFDLSELFDCSNLLRTSSNRFECWYFKPDTNSSKYLGSVHIPKHHSRILIKSIFWLKQCSDTIETIYTWFYSRKFVSKARLKILPQCHGAPAERDQSL